MVTFVKHHRRSIRLFGVDYSVPGFYFITICTKDREHLFGEIINGEMVLNEFGKIVQKCWDEIPNHFENVFIDEFVVMPNHVHGIIVVDDVDDRVDGSFDGRGKACLAPTPTAAFGNPVAGSIGIIVGSFKSAITKQINIVRETPNNPVWQRNYYEHIIRNDQSLERIRHYIRDNPFNWKTDENNVTNT